MTQADSVHSTPPTNTSAIDDTQSTIERALLPPRAESTDSIFLQPAIGQPDSGNLTGDSPSPFEDVDLALLHFVQCLIRFGLTLDEAGAVVSGELERFRAGTIKKQRRRLVLVGMRLVPMPA
jgi:hypothetical protein